jgi:Family of unknown function (DUF6526)
MAEQSYASHSRYHPLLHFIIFPLLSIDVLVRLYLLYRVPSWVTAWNVLVAGALVALAWVVRGYAVQLQDRIIRGEERLRLERLLPPELKSRIGELRTRQLIALRFASDGEVAELAKVALSEKAEPDAIKRGIRTWRADSMRV